MESLNLLGHCAVPIGLVMIGATIFQLAKGENLLTRPSVAIGACLIRLGVMPLLLIGGYIAVSDWLQIPQVLQEVALVHAAMPCAVFPIVLTRLYAGRTGIALRTVLPTCFVSLVTIPLWIKVGLGWYGW
ncbi:MAG: AEC family transporter, partial [Puniceicoccales bacterium]